MKILKILLIIFLLSGCLGQYPKLVVNEQGKVINQNTNNKNHERRK